MPTEDKVTRKLRAILSADVKGYSLLMADDEAFTVKTLKSYRALMSEQIEQHTGRVVDDPGDNLLAEFASVVDAVRCAVEIQKVLKEKNEDLPENKRLEFRIGVNIGDVIQDQDRLYGEGVNIAARIEGLADAGGVCISRNAYDHIKNKLTLGYEYIGEHAVKNIKDPVRVYKLLMADEDADKLIGDVPKPVANKWIWATALLAVIVITSLIWQVYQKMAGPDFEPAKVEEMAYPLPEKSSIAVLSFDNLTGDPSQEYFSDGISEEIITALSSVPELFVIARNSSFTYKGKSVKVQQVSEELGVRYILEGSVRRAEDKVRITAQLIDAVSGHHLWAESYDRNLEDIFVLQDEVAMKIITELQVELTGREGTRLRAPCSENLKAYLKYLEALGYFNRFTKENIGAARRLAEEAIALDPGYACAYSLLGATYYLDVVLGASTSRKHSLSKAKEMIDKAIALNPSLAGPHAMLSRVFILVRQYNKAISTAKKAIELDPNSTMANSAMGLALVSMGKSEDSIPFLKQANRIDPYSTTNLSSLGLSYFFIEQYDEAIQACKRAANINPKFLWAQLCLASTYSAAGYEKDAHAAATQILRINPWFSVEHFSKMTSFQKMDKEVFIGSLRKAGLPEYPPGKEPEKPSIAVLPFVNMSNDPEQEYFSDGLAEEIITAFSKVPGIIVISRNSSFTYKNKPTKVQQIANDLNVKYILEGSVRKDSEKVRITAQLINALNGHHMWADRYDRELKDIFAVQDEITMKILNAMEVQLTEGEQARVLKKGTKNLQVYLKLLQGLHHTYSVNPESNLKARAIYQEIISQEPNYANAYMLLARSYWLEAFLGTSKSKEETLRKGTNAAEKAISIDNSLGMSYAVLGQINILKKDWENGIAMLHKAIELEPNAADPGYYLGLGLNFADRPKEAIPMLNKAIKLNPITPGRYLNAIAISHRMLGQYDKAIEYLERATKHYPNFIFAHLNLSACYILAGRDGEAYTEAKEVLRLNPKFSVDRFDKALQLRNLNEKERFIGALRKAFSFPNDS